MEDLPFQQDEMCATSKFSLLNFYKIVAVTVVIMDDHFRMKRRIFN